MGILDSKLISGSKITLFDRVLDVNSARHRAVAGNITNVSTPGYKRKYVDFDLEMKKLLSSKPAITLETTHSNHISGKKNSKNPSVMTDHSDSNNNGVNNIDIDQEMGELSENQIIYTTAARLLANKFQGIKGAIRGRT